VRRYDGQGDDRADAVRVSPDGSKVFVTGQSVESGTNYDYATVAYDATSGARLWVSRYDGPGNSVDAATALGVSPDGSKVFVTGYSPGSGSGQDYATVAYDATSGAQLWLTRYNGPANSDDDASGLGVSPDGSKLFVTGGSAGSGSGFDYATVAYDAASGAPLWVSRYDGPAKNFDSAAALETSPDGSKVFVTGQSTGSGGGYDYATVAYDATSGARLWVSRYNGPGNSVDAASALAVSSDGSKLFVIGSSGLGYTDYATVAYDAASGSRLWVRRYNGSAGADDYPTGLGVSPDGSKLFVTGSSWGFNTYADYLTVAYDAASGARLWLTRYDGPGNSTEGASALDVSPDGSKLFVTGSSARRNGYPDYLTISYDTRSGSQLWLRRYNDASHFIDYGDSLGVSPDGSKLFVTGFSWGDYYDYATVAYSAG
jgi:PQQ-like domain